MLNPFKKKQNEFKLDDYSVPSLSEVENGPSGGDLGGGMNATNSGMPALPDNSAQTSMGMSGNYDSPVNSSESSMNGGLSNGGMDSSLQPSFAGGNSMGQSSMNSMDNSAFAGNAIENSAGASMGMNSPAPASPMMGGMGSPGMGAQQGMTPQSSSGNTNYSEMNKAKLDMIETKVSLLDARLANMEQNIELLKRLILEEVSDETKRRLNVDNMMNTAMRK